MPKVPERKPSYGELMDNLRRAHRRTEELKHEAKRAKRRKSKERFAPTYSVEDIEQRIDDLQAEGKKYYEELQ